MTKVEERQGKVALALLVCLLLTGVTAFFKAFFWIGYWPHRLLGLATLALTAVHVRHHWRKVLKTLAMLLSRKRLEW